MPARQQRGRRGRLRRRHLPSGTVSFAAGETSKTVTVQVAGDTTVESDETFAVTLSNASGGATIATASAAGIIRNDDVAATPSTFAIAAADGGHAEGDSGSSAYTFTVTRSTGIASAATVDYAVGGSQANVFSGTVAHQSANVSGYHQHYFYAASDTMSVAKGDTLFVYVRLDPDNPPTEIMLHWNDGSWGHRVYWGANELAIGVDGTEARRYMGPLPTAGEWARLEVPAGAIGLEGRTVNGMGFILNNGSATWDKAGVAHNGSDQVWFDDAVPAGAIQKTANDSWNWQAGDAADAADFVGGVLPSGTVSFAAGESSKTITVQVAGDAATENDEGFTVTLSNPSGGGSITAARAVGTIEDDDGAGSSGAGTESADILDASGGGAEIDLLADTGAGTPAFEPAQSPPMPTDLLAEPWPVVDDVAAFAA
ncbi:MAG: Calx-beta domain-containing protein [Alphaproteobacteria bacterium]